MASSGDHSTPHVCKAWSARSKSLLCPHKAWACAAWQSCHIGGHLHIALSSKRQLPPGSTCSALVGHLGLALAQLVHHVAHALDVPGAPGRGLPVQAADLRRAPQGSGLAGTPLGGPSVRAGQLGSCHAAAAAAAGGRARGMPCERALLRGPGGRPRSSSSPAPAAPTCRSACTSQHRVCAVRTAQAAPVALLATTVYWLTAHELNRCLSLPEPYSR